MRLSCAIVFVNDMKRSTSFYRDVVGLPLRLESPGWTEFDTGGATLALHKSDSRADGRSDHRLEPADAVVRASASPTSTSSITGWSRTT